MDAKLLLCWGLLLCVQWANGQGNPCKIRKTKYGNVCVCTADYCDTLEDIEPQNVGDYVVVSSSKGSAPFLVRKGLFNASAKSETTHIEVQRNKEYQKMYGFGGALTGSVSHILEKLPDSLRQHIYTSYYSAGKGIGYNMMRITIGGSDFDLAPWAYNESPRNDRSLSNFTKLDPRDERRIEQIHAIKKVADVANLRIVGSAWSPPPWMKSNDGWTGLSSLLSEYYQTWADYHVRFLEFMSDAKLPLWAITTGNEPMNGVIGWLFVKFMSLGWTPENQGKWVAQNLGPSIKNARNEDVRNVKIFTGDDQRYTFPIWMSRMRKTNPKAIDFIDGMAVHWYWDQLIGATVIDRFHSQFPDKIILNTESSDGDKPFQTHGPELGSWERAEKYITSYIQDFQHHVGGWIDWNLVLDQRGGPNYVDNFVDSPVIVNTENNDEIYKQPMFYAIGHFSRFITEGSVRIGVDSDNLSVLTLGFKRPDNSIVVIFYNRLTKDISLNFKDGERGNIPLTLPARSIHTLHYK